MMKVYDQEQNQDVYLRVSSVTMVKSVGDHDAWWQVETDGDRLFVNAVDAARVIRAMEEEDLTALSSSELQAEWERSEARMVRLGAELSRRTHT